MGRAEQKRRYFVKAFGFCTEGNILVLQILCEALLDYLAVIHKYYIVCGIFHISYVVSREDYTPFAVTAVYIVTEAVAQPVPPKRVER